MTQPAKSKEQQAAEARARGLLKERDRLGTDAAERLQLRRRAERLERVRERAAAAVAARRTQPRAGDHNAQLALQFEESK